MCEVLRGPTTSTSCTPALHGRAFSRRGACSRDRADLSTYATSCQRGVKGSLVRWALRLTADEIVFNSGFTKTHSAPRRPASSVVAYPTVDVTRLLDLPFSPPGTRAAPPCLGVVGQITPWKGQDDAIRVLAKVRERFPEARSRSTAPWRSAATVSRSTTSDTAPTSHGWLQTSGSKTRSSSPARLRIWPPRSSRWMCCSCRPGRSVGRIVVEGMAAGVPVVATRGLPRRVDRRRRVRLPCRAAENKSVDRGGSSFAPGSGYASCDR